MSTNSNPQKDSADKEEALPIAMHILRSVNDNTPDAQENKDSMKDREGRRIKFNEKNKNTSKVIRGVEKLPNTILGVED